MELRAPLAVNVEAVKGIPTQKVLAMKLELSDDYLNSDAVERTGRDLLVARLPCGESGIFDTDLSKALKFFGATKVLQSTVFLQPR